MGKNKIVLEAYPPNPNSKTGRAYGKVVAAIRQVAERGIPFTHLDFGGGRPHRQMLSNMWRHGELTRLQPGLAGNGGIPAIYIAKPQEAITHTDLKRAKKKRNQLRLLVKPRPGNQWTRLKAAGLGLLLALTAMAAPSPQKISVQAMFQTQGCIVGGWSTLASWEIYSHTNTSNVLLRTTATQIEGSFLVEVQAQRKSMAPGATWEPIGAPHWAQFEPFEPWRVILTNIVVK